MHALRIGGSKDLAILAIDVHCDLCTAQDKKKLESTVSERNRIPPHFKGETMKITSKQKGFSLIELLIVVAIILIIAAIAIPNLLRARMAANQSSAVGSLRTIVTSEFNYQQTYGIGYAPLTNLGSTTPCATRLLWRLSAAACLVDSQLSSGTKSGYNVTTPAPAGSRYRRGSEQHFHGPLPFRP